MKELRPERAPLPVGGQEAGADAARADGRYLPVRPKQELSADVPEVFPPHLFRIVLGPAWTRKRQFVRPLGDGDDFAVGAAEHSLRARGSYIYSE